MYYWTNSEGNWDILQVIANAILYIIVLLNRFRYLLSSPFIMVPIVCKNPQRPPNSQTLMVRYSLCSPLYNIILIGHVIMVHECTNTLRQRQNGRHFEVNLYKFILFNENLRILIKISLMFVPNSAINNIPALVQIVAWRQPGDKPLSEPMLRTSLTHICVTRPLWVN